MEIRTIWRVGGSLTLLHLLVHHDVAVAQSTPSSSGTVETPSVGSNTSTVTSPAVASSTSATTASPPSPVVTPVEAPTPAASTLPTAQFETEGDVVPESAPTPAPSPQPETPSAASPVAHETQGSTSVPPNEPSSVSVAEQRVPPNAFKMSFEDSRAALNAAGQYEPFELRQREMPGDYVARPVTLPEGTFELTLNNYLAFADASEVVGWVPSFAFGLTSSFTLGMSAPLRYNESLQEWTKLDPLVNLAQQWLDQPELEAAARLAVLIPVTSESATQVEVGVPLLWHVSSSLRMDAEVNAVVALEDATQAAINVPLALTLQAASWIYAGVSATPNLGLTKDRKAGVDAGARVGLTLQSRGSAHVDLVAAFFAENVGTGRDGQTTDGVGTVLTAAFFPEVY